MSVSPPPSSAPPRSQSASSPEDSHGRMITPGERETESIASRLGNMNLPPPDSRLDLSDVVVAIEGVANGPDEQAPLLEPKNSNLRSQSPNLLTTQRSRSASRARVASHDVKDEELPPDHFHDPAVQQAFRDAKALLSSLTDVLGSGSLHTDVGSQILRLHRQANDLARFQCPSTRTVGFVGDSGVGMYSTIAYAKQLSCLTGSRSLGKAVF